MLQLIIPLAALLAIAFSMVVTAETIIGAGYINGIQGAITMTGVATFNMSDRQLTDEFASEEIPAQNGATIEAAIASKRVRNVECTFAPKGATRVAAEAVITSLFALGPYAVITVAASTVSVQNGTFNYMGGAYIKETRDGYAVAGIKLKQFETATQGTFAALAIIVG